MVETYWNPETDYLIQLGDLINKGPYSGLCIKYWQKLEEEYPYQVFMLKGNHEQQFIDNYKKIHILNSELVENIEDEGVTIKNLLEWFKPKPLKWETPYLLVTHAGINKSAKDPYSLTDSNGVLHNRGPLAFLEKVQVVGHRIVLGNKPVFSPKENAWHLDTGAWSKKYLSALRLDYNGENPKIFRTYTSDLDKKGI